MTTDHDLRDLLTAEADGPVHPAPSWDAVVRRGHQRRRIARVRSGIAIGGLAAVVAVGAFALTDRDPDDRTPVVVDQPDQTTTSTALDGIDGQGFTAARVQGVFVTVVLDQLSSELCEALHPRVTESATEVVVEVVPASFSSGQPWAACQTSRSSSWATIELTDPLGDRRLVDATDGEGVTVIDGTPLLFPTYLPEPFDIERWDEFGGFIVGGGDLWTFDFTDGDLALGITTVLSPAKAQCEGGQAVDVRGVVGALCDADLSTAVLEWAEGSTTWRISVSSVRGEPPNLPLGEMVAIAEGLEPLGGMP